MYLCKKKSSGERSCGSLFTPASRLDRLEDFGGGGEGRGGEESQEPVDLRLVCGGQATVCTHK